MLIEMRTADARLFDDVLRMIARSARQMGKPESAAQVEALRVPFTRDPVEVDEMQAMALQAVLVAMLDRVEKGRPGFTSDAVRLMRELSAELNRQQKKQ